MAFSVMLWMPSWGGMINGLMTLSGAWDKLRTDPGLRFSVTAVGFYGMSTFEGPVMSMRDVNSLSHYTDWTIGHVHSGALGWVAFISFGAIYYLVPVLWKRPGLYSMRLGVLALLDRDARHRALHHRDVGCRHHAGPDVARLRRARLPAVLVRRDGRWRCIRSISSVCSAGVLFLIGALIMVYNMMRTVRGTISTSEQRTSARQPSPWRGSKAMFIRHEFIEKNAILMLVLTLITVAIGGIVQIIPLFTIESTIERVNGVRPYTPLEQLGRNIYVREGCYLCHSQQIRPFQDEVERYGHYSLAAESMYDKPFQWGSKRTGPDLARVGGSYSNDWHSAHLAEPRAWCRKRDAGLCVPGGGTLESGRHRGASADAARRRRAVHGRDDRQRRGRSGGAGQSRRRQSAALLKRYPKAVSVPGNGPSSPRWMLWWPTCRCWAPWSTSPIQPTERLRQ